MKVLNILFLCFYLTVTTATAKPIDSTFYSATDTDESLCAELYEITAVSYLFDEGWDDECVIRLENDWVLWFHWYDGHFRESDDLAIVITRGSSEEPEKIDIFELSHGKWVFRAEGIVYPGSLTFRCS